MEKELVVTFGLDNTPAQQAAKQFRADQKAMLADVAATATASEKAAAAAAKAGAAAKIGEAKKYRDAQGRFIKEGTEAYAAAEKAAAAATKNAVVEKIRAGSMFKDAQARNVRAMLADDEAYANTSGQRWKRLWAEKQAAAAGSVKAIGAAARRTDSTFGESAGGAAKFLGSMLAMKAGEVVIAQIMDSIKGVSRAMADANTQSQAQIDKLLATKDVLRDLLAMTTGGKGGPDDAAVDRLIRVRKLSGQTTEEAKATAMEFEGAGAATKGKTISDKEYDKFRDTQLPRYVATQGGGTEAAGTYGKLGGLLAGMGKYDKAEDLTAAMSQFNKILSKGVGNNPTLIKQSAMVAGAYINSEEGKGVMKDPRELAAVTAVASRINPEQSGEIMKSTTRMMRGFSEKWAPLLKKAGMTEQDTYSEGMSKLSKHLEGVEKSGRKVDAYLSEEGVDAAAGGHIAAMYNNRQMLKDTLAEEGVTTVDDEQKKRGIKQGRKLTGKEANAEIDERYTRDPTLRIKQEMAAREGAELRAAMPKQYARELQLKAETKLIERGEGEDQAAAGIEDEQAGKRASMWGLTLPEGMTSKQLGRKMRVEREMKRQAEAAGDTVPNRPKMTVGKDGKEKTTQEYLNWLMSGEDVNAYSQIGEDRQNTANVSKEKLPGDPGFPEVIPQEDRKAWQKAGGARPRLVDDEGAANARANPVPKFVMPDFGVPPETWSAMPGTGVKPPGMAGETVKPTPSPAAPDPATAKKLDEQTELLKRIAAAAEKDAKPEPPKRPPAPRQLTPAPPVVSR